MKFFDASRYASPLRKALDKKENAPRNLRFETLETRSLLSVTPLDELQAAVASAEIAPAQTVETPVVDLSALAVSNATTEDGAIDLGTLNKTTTVSGTVQASQTNGVWVGDSVFYKVEFLVVGNSDHSIVLNNAFTSGVDGVNDSVNLNLYLYKADGSLIDSATTTGKYATTETIQLAGVAAGTYYIEVRQAIKESDADAYKHGFAHNYSLTITPPTVPQDDYESNDTLATATDLGVAGYIEVEAKSSLARDHDYFKFTIPATAGAEDFVKIEYTQADYTNLALALFDSVDAKAPIRNNATTNSTKTLSLENLPAGEYYVRVYNVIPEANRAIDYTLEISAPQVAPVAPTGFKTNGNEAADDASKLVKNETKLVWNNVYGETGYELRYTTDVDKTDAEAEWVEAGTVAADVLAKEIGLAYGKSYKYQVRAVNDFGQSDWVSVEFFTVAPPQAPSIYHPDELYLDPNDLTITMKWWDYNNGDADFIVEQKVGDKWVAVSETIPANKNTWKSGKLDFATTYTYRVVAINAAGRAASEPATITTSRPADAPADLTAIVDPATLLTKLTWTKVENATDYKIYRSVDDQVWTYDGNVQGNVTSYQFSQPNLTGQTLYYRVEAYNAYGFNASDVQVMPEAASTIVTTADDVLDPFDNQTSLREAIARVSSVEALSGSTITFAEELRGETFKLTSQLEIKKSVTIEGLVDEAGAPAITISGDNNFRVFNVNGDGVDQTLVKLSDLTITGGFVSPPYGQYAHGAGVSVERAKATFDNVAFYQNSYSLQSDSHTSVSYASVKGTALYAGENAEVIVTNSEFVENVAYNGYGAAHIAANAKATFENVKMTGNQGGFGGALHIAGEATLTNVEMSGNYSNGNAGALYVASAGSATVTNAKITDNTATYGGAVSIYDGSATFTNVQMTGNTSTYNGGAVRATGNSAATFTNVTIADNKVLQGDGNTQYRASVYVPVTSVDAVPSVSFRNSIIVGGEVIEYNTTGVHLPTQPLTVVNTVTSYDYLANLSGTGNIYYNDEAAVPAPLFANAANGDYRLAVDSVARDKGLDAWLYDEDGKPIVATDLAGNPRFNNTVDIGALENQTPDAPTNFKTNGDETTWNKTTLSWDDVDLETSYELQVSTDGGQTWTPAGTTEADVTTFELADLDYGTAYRYQLRAVHADGASAWVNLKFSTVAVPTAPTNLAVSKLDPETRKVTFTWSKVDDANEYVVLLSTADGQTQVTLPVGTTSWTPDVEFALGSSGSISITPANNAGVGGKAVLNFTVEDVPAQPTDLTATVNASSAPTVTLNWTNVEGETGYRVEVQAEDETGTYVWTTLDELGADVDNYKIDVQMGQTYYYRVVALNEYGETASDHAWVTVGDVPTQPEPKVVFRPSSFPQATLTWAAESEAAYVVEQLVDDAWVTVATLEKGVGEWTTDALVYGPTYSYRVGASNGYGVGETSEAVEITLEAASTVVTTTSDVFDLTDGQITLREAIAYAQKGDTIAFDESLRGATITLSGSELLIDKALTIQGFVDETGAPQITIDADGKSRVFNVAAGSAKQPVVLSGLIVTGGYATSGAGVYVAWNSTVNFTNAQITANEATQHGGGLFVGGKGTFENVLVDNNKAAYAAGVFVNGQATFNNATISGNVASVHGGGARVDGKATFENTTIVDNSANTYGGGVYVFQGTANFTNAQIRQNSAATYGGGVYVVKGAANFNGANIAENTATYGAGAAVGSNGQATFVNTEITGGVATYGAGVYVAEKATANFADTQIAGNEAIKHGGGVYVNGTAVFENDVISANKAAYAAGVIVGGNGEATFNNGTISGNVASVHGGGARVDGKATFENTTIVDNSAATYGGGVYVVKGTANFTNAQIRQNSAATYGGGVYVVKGAANFNGANIAKNTATYGAGVAATQTSEVAFADGTITDNKASKYGGGLYAVGKSTVNFADAQVTGNEATQHGGGLYVGGKGTFENVLVDNNKAAYAAGVIVGGNGEATFNNATISGNVASVHGGGARVDGKATFENTTIVDNSAATYGGGVYVVQGTANFTNATIANNTAVAGAGVRVNNDVVANFKNSIVLDSVLSLGGNLNAYNTLSSFVGWSNAETDQATQFVYAANQPLFADGSYALAAGSQAIDKGADEYLGDATTDLAGNARIAGNAVDLGAYEFQTESAETPISAAFADAFDELDFFVDEDELDALAKRLV